MTSYFSRLSPVPGFSPYTGPHKVGTIDVELPINELESPSPAPTEDIPTIQYRIFYPCEPDAKCKKSVNWLPAPQRGYVSAYTRFLGAGSLLADIISYVLKSAAERIDADRNIVTSPEYSATSPSPSSKMRPSSPPIHNLADGQ
jgi:hypothetical protein